MNIAKTPLVSVIIPVYNVEKYLEKCLDSIINQTYKNIEIICINDGSTDSSLEILRKYAEKDNRIKVVNQENKGLGATRNVGLEIAQGEFISFIDSDDFVDKNLYKNCIEKIASDIDVIVFGAKTVNLKNNKIYSGQYSSKSFHKNFNLNDLFNIYTVAWNKLYRHSLLNEHSIIFDTPKTGEDQTFFIKVVLNAKNICVVKKDLYYYIKYRNGALSNRKDSTDLSTIENTYSIINYLKNKELSVEIKNKIISHYLLKTLSWFSKIEKEKKSEVFNMVEALFSYTRHETGKFWWDYYNLRERSSYFSIKLEYGLAMLKYSLRERGIFFPAIVIFGMYLVTLFFKKDGHE